jgi:molybdopterin-guanine dinucleotide biosynthesis protein
VKFIHHPEFTLNPEAKDTDRHLKAGAKFTLSFAPKETAILIKKEKRQNIPDLQDYLQHSPGIFPDFDVIFVESLNKPPNGSLVILSADTSEDLIEYYERLPKVKILAITGKISKKVTNWKNIQCFDVNCPEQLSSLRTIISTAFEL